MDAAALQRYQAEAQARRAALAQAQAAQAQRAALIQQIAAQHRAAVAAAAAAKEDQDAEDDVVEVRRSTGRPRASGGSTKRSGAPACGICSSGCLVALISVWLAVPSRRAAGLVAAAHSARSVHATRRTNLMRARMPCPSTPVGPSNPIAQCLLWCPPAGPAAPKAPCTPGPMHAQHP